MTQTITFLVTLQTPHTDEPLNDAERATNCVEARLAILQAVQGAGFTVVAVEEAR